MVRLPFCTKRRTLPWACAPWASAGPVAIARPAASIAPPASVTRLRRIVFINPPPLPSRDARGRIPFRPPPVFLLLRHIPEHRHRRHDRAVEAGALRIWLIPLAEIDVGWVHHPILLQL